MNQMAHGIYINVYIDWRSWRPSFADSTSKTLTLVSSPFFIMFILNIILE